MNLPKFLDLLVNRSIYFRRADGFADRLEGALFPSLRELIDKAHLEGESSDSADAYYEKVRTGNYVSCWSLGNRDNMGLWQLTASTPHAVCIVSTVDRLINTAMTWRELVRIYKVRYIDHKKPPDYVIGNPTDVLQYKHKAYRYESELRVALYRPKLKPQFPADGIRLPIGDLSMLVRSVEVSPSADDNTIALIRDLCAKYSLRAPVKKSVLADLPV